MKNILITGGAGYFGSVLSGWFLDAGYTVHVLDALRYGDMGVVPYLYNENYNFWNGNILDSDLLQTIFNKFDISIVIHLAALVGEPLCKKYTKTARQVNLEGTKAVIEFSKNRGVSQFIFASTCSVYGASDSQISEDSPLQQTSLYAETKIEAEKYVSQFPFSTVLRFATLFGSSPRMRFDIILNQFVAQASSLNIIELYEPIDAWRPLIHLKDACEAVLRCVEKPDLVKGEFFNVGGNSNNCTKHDLAKFVQASIPTTQIDVKGIRRDRRNYFVSFNKICNVLSFIPETSVAAGIDELSNCLRSCDPTLPIYDNLVGYNQHSMETHIL